MSWEPFDEEASAQRIFSQYQDEAQSVESDPKSQAGKQIMALRKEVLSHIRDSIGLDALTNPRGDIGFLTPDKNPMMVSVREDSLIEIWGLISTSADDKEKAHEFIDHMSAAVGPIKYKILHTNLYRMRILVAEPFIPEHLEYAFKRDPELFDKEVKLFQMWKEHGYQI